MKRLTANRALRSVKRLNPSLRESDSVTHKAMANEPRRSCHAVNSVVCDGILATAAIRTVIITKSSLS
jgi:hypothetical protein